MINIALYQPDIPQNTAAVIRTCACLGLNLEIIKPAGFIINEKKLGRIYMDYLNECNILYYDSFDHFLEKKKNNRLILFTTKSKNSYHKFKFKNGDTLIFGSESRGASQKVHDSVNFKLNIPIKKVTRSLNLATSVAIGSSEAIRQTNDK